ncbi:MAG: glycerol-3-phosphate acyltransferase, partial [Bacteroidetes bacterium]|nr:glycerol-3-phosphate acyltransferase [Bacteroidota bacterium]
ALNSYEITNNKLIGLLVLLFDALKGVAAVFFSYYIIFPSLFYVLISIIFVVLGHDFNIFLKFKGGRGLATSLGALLCFNPLLVIIWCCIWFLFYKIVKNDILFANSLSSVVTPVVIIFTADYVFYLLQYNFNVDILEYKIFSIVLCMIIFASHHRNIRLK